MVTAALPDLDVRAGRRRRPARRLRVQPQRQPDPHRAGDLPRRARRRRARASRSRAGSPPRTPCCARVLQPGDHVVIPGDAYGGTFRLFAKVLERWGLAYTAVDQQRPRRGARARSATTPGWSGARPRPTRCSASPTSRRSPSIAHDAGALLGRRQHVRVAVPAAAARARRRRRRALDDEVPRRPQRRRRRRAGRARRRRSPSELAFHQNAMGAVAGPFDSWLVLRGIKTLGVRMDRHCDNAERVVAMLREHPAVDRGLLPRHRRGRGASRCAASAAWCRSGSRAARQQALEVCGTTQGLHPRRVARRRRVADRAPGAG